jgi:hypothetical protein
MSLSKNHGSTISTIKSSKVDVVRTAAVCEVWSVASEEEKRSVCMGRCSEPEHSTLGCECGERIVVFGLVEDWRSRRAVFRCECGEKITLEDARVEAPAGSSGKV